MNGDIWRTPSGETGPEVDRQRINGEVVVKVLLPQPAGMSEWHARVEYIPLADLVAVPNELTRYGGDRGGRAEARARVRERLGGFVAAVAAG